MYPADISGINAQPVPYLDHPKEQIEAIAEQLEVPSYLLSNIKNISTNAYLNVPIISDQGTFPILFFSHGLGGMKNQNSIQIEALVHQGYIVVAPDHTYDATITIFDDGSTVEFKSGLPDDISTKEFWDIRLPQINTRAGDLSFIIDKLQTMNNHPIYNSINFVT